MKKPQLTYSVKVPTKSYLRKYIYAKYGQSIKLNYTTTLGTLILCMLDKEAFTIKMSDQKKEQRIQYMNDEIVFTAPLNTMRWKGYSLSKDKIIAINRYLEDMFVEDLHRFCKFNIKDTAWRPGIKDAIFSFADSYGIEVDTDISFDALKKAEFRYKKRNEKKVVTSVPTSGRPSQLGFLVLDSLFTA